MHTRSQSRNLHNQQHQAPPPVVEPFNLEEPIENPDPLAPMDDTRTMAHCVESPPLCNVYRDNIQENDSQAAASNYNQGNTGLSSPDFQSNSTSRFSSRSKTIINVQIKETIESLQPKTEEFQSSSSFTKPPGYIKALYRPQYVQPPAYQAPAYQAPAPQGITTRSGVAYKGPTIHTTSSSKVVEREPDVTKDTMPPTNNGSTEDVQPLVVPVVHHESISEPVNAPVSASMPNQKASIPFPPRRNDERRREKANDQIEKFYAYAKIRLDSKNFNRKQRKVE
ncbi:hypothetical protein Tco_0860726 [Tanacetum coccineum]|uniref:Uncharacterized protein n=1 Tax=Tanacetum coccineum TaxID=301880 RepID=A0ABQ5BHH6_9ASTR